MALTRRGTCLVLLFPLSTAALGLGGFALAYLVQYYLLITPQPCNLANFNEVIVSHTRYQYVGCSNCIGLPSCTNFTLCGQSCCESTMTCCLVHLGSLCTVYTQSPLQYQCYQTSAVSFTLPLGLQARNYSFETFDSRPYKEDKISCYYYEPTFLFPGSTGYVDLNGYDSSLVRGTTLPAIMMGVFSIVGLIVIIVMISSIYTLRRYEGFTE